MNDMHPRDDTAALARLPKSALPVLSMPKPAMQGSAVKDGDDVILSIMPENGTGDKLCRSCRAAAAQTRVTATMTLLRLFAEPACRLRWCERHAAVNEKSRASPGLFKAVATDQPPITPQAIRAPPPPSGAGWSA